MRKTPTKTSKTRRPAAKNGARQHNSRNGSEEPESLEAQIVDLALSGKLANAARRARRDLLAHGLPITFMRGRSVIKKYPDGREEVLEIIPRRTYAIPPGVAILGKP